MAERTTNEFITLLRQNSGISAVKAYYESEAARLTSESFASEAPNVPVKLYTSNEDGTYTITDIDPVTYSSLHYANESAGKIRNVETPTVIAGQQFISTQYDPRAASVFLNGSLLMPNDIDYTSTVNSITLVEPIEENNGQVDEIQIITGTILPATSDKKPVYVASLSEMLNTDPAGVSTLVWTDSNKGGIFVYNSSLIATNNGGTIFNGWVRQYSGAINTKWFDTLTNCFLNNGEILIDGQYEIASRLTVLSDTKVTQTDGSYIQNTDTTLILNGTRPATDNGVFEVLNGSTNITFDSLDIRGAWYDTTMVYRDNNIGINISGRFDMENQYSDKYDTGVPALITTDIKVINCNIEGFAQSAVIADNINRFMATNNTILNCGRDGIRLYGCKEFICSTNHIKNIAPGYDGISPNYNVYGIAATSAYKQLPVSRPSEQGVVDGNTIENCTSWKSLDTHGGHDIIYSNNTCRNSHIGMGIDKGGYLASGAYNPATQITVIGNTFINDQANPLLKRAGITVFAHANDDEQIGKDIILSSNYISGYGTDTADGAINISNQRNVVINNNTIVDSLKSAIQLSNTVEVATITGNIIRNVTASGAGVKDGITPINLVGDITVSANVFMADVTPFVPMTIDSSANNNIQYSSDNISKNCLDVVGIINSTGGLLYDTVAYGRLSSAGTIFDNVGLHSIVSTGVGLATVVLTDTYTKVTPVISGGHTSAGIIATIESMGVDVGTGFTDIKIRCFNSAGTLVDAVFYLQVNGYK